MSASKRSSVKEILLSLYGKNKGTQAFRTLQSKVDALSPPAPPIKKGWDEQDVWLITYGDTLMKKGSPPLQTLETFLDHYLGDLVTFLHILPFFPFSSDDGFSVMDYRKVDKNLGSWDHIETLGQRYRLVFDAVINHVSSKSYYLKRFLKNIETTGPFFIEIDPKDHLTKSLSKVVRPRALPLLHSFETVNGPKLLWTTFSKDQVDLNYKNPSVLLEILDILLFYVQKGASAIRLDAIAYLWKEVGTPCIHLPQTHKVVQLIRAFFDQHCSERLVLTETNVPHEENISYFGDGTNEAHLVYNFTLAPLLVHCIHTGEAHLLT